MKRTTVNPAWPAANEIARERRRRAGPPGGSTAHSTASWVPIAITSAAPTSRPTAVPASALTIEEPVARAFERRTHSVPRTTQKACWRPARSAQGQPDGSANAVAEPDRPCARVFDSELLGCL